MGSPMSLNMTTEKTCIIQEETEEEAESSENMSYEDNVPFSNEGYDRFAFVQDATCNMNDMAGMPDSCILLDGHSTVDIFMNKNLCAFTMMLEWPLWTRSVTLVDTGQSGTMKMLLPIYYLSFFGSGNDTWLSWRNGRIGGNSNWRNGKLLQWADHAHTVSSTIRIW